MVNALVTGGAGFIGSNFLHLAVQEGWYDSIRVVDNLGPGSNRNNLPNHDSITLIQKNLGDITDQELSSVNHVINFGAESHVDRSITGSLVFSDHNYMQVHRLLETIRQSDADIRFLQISTDEVYGSILDGSFSETNRLHPRNPYSASKAAAEMIVTSYIETYGLDCLITRSSNNYGPRQFTEKLLPKMISNFAQNKPIGIYGDGKQVRDWTFVMDNCRGVKLVLDKGDRGEIYNISANNEVENLEITHKVAQLMDVNFEYVSFIEDRLGHDFRYSIETSKIRELGWSPQIDFEEGLRYTIDWYMKEL